VAALTAEKHVFLEKPAALNIEQYDLINSALAQSKTVLMLGYNRRYSPLAIKLKNQLDQGSPKIIEYHVHIPEVPQDHWTLDPVTGGGRLIGEAEHFFDFCYFLAGSKLSTIRASYLTRPGETKENQINFVVNMTFENSTIATLTYTSLGASKNPREVIKVHQSGQTFELNNFKSLTRISSNSKTSKLLFQNLGHELELDHFAKLITGGIEYEKDTVLVASHMALTAQKTLE